MPGFQALLRAAALLGALGLPAHAGPGPHAREERRDPGAHAEGQGDAMITETYEALHYARADPRLHAAFIDAPLTPPNTPGFMLPADDAGYTRALRFVWELLEQRGVLQQAARKWLR